MLFVDVTAEDRHGTNTDTEREERLVHCGDDHIPDSLAYKPVHIRDQKITDPFSCAGQEEAVDGKDEHDDDEHGHHYLCYALQTALKAAHIDKETDNDNERHASDLDSRVQETV